MPDEFPGNSRSGQGRPPKVKKVVQGEVVRRKKPLGKRFAETFFQGDSRSVWGYVLFDVLIPAAKDTLADAVSQGIERKLYGEARSSSRRTGSRPGGPGGYISYNRYADNKSSSRREEPRGTNRRTRGRPEIGEICLKTRVEAEEVLDNLRLLVSEYDQATVMDYYGLLGEPTDYPDDKYGWTDLSNAGVDRVQQGYLLDLPRPEPLGEG